MTYEIQTTVLVAGGDALGRLPDGRAVFVAGAAPRETVQVRLVKEDARWARGELLSVLEPSVDRVVPSQSASHLGGATWAHVAYPAQLAAKQAIVATALERIGKFVSPAVAPIVASPERWGYRNRIELTFGEQGGELVLGTLAPGSQTDVQPALGSALFGDEVDAIIAKVLAWARGTGRRAWRPRALAGELRSLIVRRGIQSRDRLVHLVTTSAATPDPSLAEALAGLGLTGIVWSANDAKNAVSEIQTSAVLFGRPTITEQLLDLPLVYHATSFFQANVHAAELLLATLRDAVQAPAELVDLYAGVGTFGLGVAPDGVPLTLVELHPQAVRDAHDNTGRLGRLRDVVIAEAGAEAYLRRYSVPKRATVIVDPPRTGLERAVVRGLLRDRPSRLVYISCDPATLARDLRLLGEAYEPTLIQPFDFFPQTPHVETLVVLSLQ